MGIESIAAAATAMKASNVQAEASILMLKKVKDNMESNGDQMAQMIESAGVNNGKSLDMHV